MKIVLPLFLVFSMLYGAGASVISAQNTAESIQTSQIRGTVVDLLGRPITGATVKFLVDSATIANSTTGGNGKFALSGVASGNGEIQIESVGFKKYRKPMYLNPGQKIVIVAGLEAGLLSPGPDLHIRGRILDSRSKPVPSANVTVRSVFNENIAVTTETTLAGDYHLEATSFGQYFVTVDLPGFKVVGRILLLAQEGTYRADFRLGRKVVSWRRNETLKSWDASSESLALAREPLGRTFGIGNESRLEDLGTQQFLGRAFGRYPNLGRKRRRA